jgi:hypothetical protein
LSNFTRRPKEKKEKKKKGRQRAGEDVSQVRRLCCCGHTIYAMRQLFSYSMDQQQETVEPANAMFEDLQEGTTRSGLSMQQVSFVARYTSTWWVS